MYQNIPKVSFGCRGTRAFATLHENPHLTPCVRVGNDHLVKLSKDGFVFKINRLIR